jgi:hypothetical protein
MSFRTLVGCVAALAISACASTSTKLTSTWAAPEAESFQPRKILVTAPAAETSRRLSAEVRMAQLIPNAVTSTSTFLRGEEKDPERVRARIRELGIDAVVIMRPIAVDTTTEYVPPSVSMQPMMGVGYAYGFWGPSYATVYDPGYTREKTVAIVETSIYAVEGEKLLWISRSRTMNPQNVNSAIDSIIAANVDSMRKQGLISR